MCNIMEMEDAHASSWALLFFWLAYEAGDEKHSTNVAAVIPVFIRTQ